MFWSMVIATGLSYDKMLRMAQMALTLEDNVLETIIFEKDETKYPWVDLLTESQKTKLNDIETYHKNNLKASHVKTDIKQLEIDYKKNPQQALDASKKLRQQIQQISTMVCRCVESIQKYPVDDHYLLIASDAQKIDINYLNHYKNVFGFAPFANHAITPFVNLPVAVHKDIFYPPHKNEEKHVLVISHGDIIYNIQICQYLKNVGIQNITLFDPYFLKSAYLSYENMHDVHIFERCASDIRAKIFSVCSHVIVANPIIHTDNHFLWESFACGNRIIAGYVPINHNQEALWTESLIKTSIEKSIQHAPYIISSLNTENIIDWHDIGAYLTFDTKPREMSHSYNIGSYRIDTFYSLEALKENQDNNPICDSIIIYFDYDIVWEDNFQDIFKKYKHIYLDMQKNALIYSTFVNKFINKSIKINIYFQKTLHEIKDNTNDKFLHIVYIGDNYAIQQENHHKFQSYETMTNIHDISIENTPTVFVQSSKIPKPGLISRGNIGITVANHSFLGSLLFDSPGRYNLLWTNKNQTHDDHGRTYFYPYFDIVGFDKDEIDIGSIPRLLQNNEIDLITSADPLVSNAIKARTLWAKKNIPIVGILHSIHASMIADEVIHQIFNGPNYVFDGVISPSVSGMIAYKNLFTEILDWLHCLTGKLFYQHTHIEVIPYGIDTSAYHGLHKIACRQAFNITNDKIVFLAFGRINKQEKSDLLPLLLATQEMIKNGIPALIMIAGGFNQEIPHNLKYIEDMIHTLDISNHVQIFPTISPEDKTILYGAADIFISLSDNIQETFGMVLLEAMAASLPIIASDWDGYREIVEHGETGFLIPTYWTNIPNDFQYLQDIANGYHGYGHRDLHESIAIDSIALYKSMEILAKDMHLRKKLGENGKKVCDIKYNQHKQSKKVGDFLLDCIKRAQKETFQLNNEWPVFADFVNNRFSHYPTKFLQKDSILMLHHHLSNKENIEQIIKVINPIERAEKKLLTDIIEAFETKSSYSIHELIMHINSKQFSYEQIKMRILRCLKYHVLVTQDNTEKNIIY